MYRTLTASSQKGFTLVELIVVITIVGILSTIGFVSYSGYLTGARDSNRISQMVKLTDSMQVYSASKSLPLPDKKTDIIASGALNIVGYQGKVGVDVLETIDYTNGGEDPKDDTYFTYFLSRDRKSMQLLTFLEEPSSTVFWNSAYAVDYSERFPKVYGRKLGVLLLNTTDATKNTPAEDQELSTIDIVLGTWSYVSYVSDDDQIIGTGTVLREIIPNGSCRRIKETGGWNTNGIYDIQPSGSAAKKAYCNMEDEGGGWTLLARSKTAAPGTLALATATGSVTNLDTLYSLGSTGMIFDKSLFASYTSGRSLDKYKTADTTGNAVTLTNSPHTLTGTGIAGGAANDGYFGKQGMLFVK